MRDVIPTAYRYSLATAYIPDYFLHLASFSLLSPEGLVVIFLKISSCYTGGFRDGTVSWTTVTVLSPPHLLSTD
jgi:hypothetical protein